MIEYLLTFIVYLIIEPIVGIFYANGFIGLVAKLAAVGALLVFFWKKYYLKFRINWLSLAVGLIIFLAWVGLEGKYPQLPGSTFQDDTPIELIPVILKLIISILIAPLIEELFTRSFLIRWLISDKWQKVPLGKFTPFSFIVTVLFFGVSHNRWLPGLIAGVLLNLLLYKEKDVNHCIAAHAVANAALAAYVLWTDSFYFW